MVKVCIHRVQRLVFQHGLDTVVTNVLDHAEVLWHCD